MTRMLITSIAAHAALMAQNAAKLVSTSAMSNMNAIAPMMVAVMNRAVFIVVCFRC